MSESQYPPILRYLFHGLALAVLLTIFGFGWFLVAFFLVFLGDILGLIVAFGVYFVLLGYVNAWITEALWFPVAKGLLKGLFQGFLLFLALVPLNLLTAAVQAYVSSQGWVSVLVLVAVSPLTGFLGERIARIWRSERPSLAPWDTPPAPPPRPVDFPRK